MKHLFKVLLISFVFVSCKQKIQSADIPKINGYWEIEKVVFDKGEDKEYGANQNYDYFQIDKNNWQILVNKENIKEIQDYLIPKKTYPTNGLIIGNYYGLDKGTLIYTFEEVPYIKTIDIYQFRKYILPTKELNTVKENNLRFKIGDKVNINGIPFGIRFIKEILDNDFYKLNDDSVFYIDSLKLIPIVEKEEINNTQYIIAASQYLATNWFQLTKLDLKKPHFHKLGLGFLDLEASFYTLAGYLLFVVLVLLVFLGLMGLKSHFQFGVLLFSHYTFCQEYFLQYIL